MVTLIQIIFHPIFPCHFLPCLLPSPMPTSPFRLDYTADTFSIPSLSSAYCSCSPFPVYCICSPFPVYCICSPIPSPFPPQPVPNFIPPLSLYSISKIVLSFRFISQSPSPVASCDNSHLLPLDDKFLFAIWPAQVLQIIFSVNTGTRSYNTIQFNSIIFLICNNNNNNRRNGSF